ncbi:MULTISPECIES: hypothetical protein [unclassified Mycolicibacterium]|uniref:hypothetical protein n=1 Tax=unclassified Mycolicibacterium TaxID=2636767 RepID=UPI0012DFCC67|nr:MULTISPECIES: hypothetical protein [unclassified Mycolicibacterium]MUL82849.1 hypothetical protein [Mycolicibacterium sp. CBMA 329]MUL89184.1 hypothetical protein [Mycolicibacterium sp. CBMA 331]MUL97751.1 hypothetical protein [Mycolicibacterium sp. CBMA 334]MUM25136.1 hypothetical protein [Mycolicibacterium sp. CBMA 295]MUM38700.1 hypothetical protein [Mycolicibacterium sp. CBMA 247]
MLGRGIEEYKKPDGEHRADMVGPGAWPETEESEFNNRQTMLGGIHTKLTGAKEGWQSGQSFVNSENNWAGVSATACSAKVDTHTKAMEKHEQQLTAAKGWCGEAAGLINRVKGTIVETVETAVGVINDTIENAKGKNTGGAVSDIKGLASEINKKTVQWAADTVLGKDGVDPEPPKGSKDDFEKARDKRGNDDGKPGDNPMLLASSAAFNDAEVLPPAPTPTADVEQPAPAVDAAKFNDAEALAPVATPKPKPATEIEPAAPAAGATNLNDATMGGTARPTPAVPPTANPGKPATVSPAPGGSTPSGQSPSSGVSAGAGGGIGGGGGASGASGAPSSPLSSSGSSGPSGLEQAASASQAAGQAPAGRAPTDPLQAFSKGFADSAGTPVHAASSGGSPPPLAPSPAVPASDAMAPASTTSLSSAQAPAPPVQAPPSGGSMGMGGGMPMAPPPLGPPPTPPPAAPVPPPTAAAPPPAQPANVAGGAQVAPIPVSAARAERDAAQNAAKRSGSDPLELARRLAAALNAPGMANSADYKFFWITGLTVDGKIVVANNYGLAYIPEQVYLPEPVNMASADESIPPAERASWVTHPIVAVQRWAQHHDTELRAVIATEDQFKNSDAGVHHEVLRPEDIPASGKMAGRDRLQVIAPQASSQLARISDADLVKVLPPAPTDVNPPEDRRTALWDKVWQPLASRASNRGDRHLQAFVAYSTHAQEQAIFAAHTAPQPEDQRRAVSEFIYWQHVGQLIADALAQ